MSEIIFVRLKKGEENIKVELEKIAEKESRTLVSIVRQAIKEYLERRESSLS